MRLRKSIHGPCGLAVLSLIWAGPAFAGDPDWVNGQPPSAATRPHKRGHLCADCRARAAAEKAGIPAPPSVASAAPGTTVSIGSPVPCAACQQGAGGSAPGVAFVGDGSAPGYAMVGGVIPSAEPTPVGIVRTNYNMNGQGTLAGSLGGQPGMYLGLGPQAQAQGNADQWAASAPTFLGSTSPRRPHIIGHLMGFDGPSWLERRRERRRTQHASVAYGTRGPSSVYELPASTVYRR